MTDDSNLLEFSLHEDDSEKMISDSTGSNAASKQALLGIDNEIQSHIDAIIANIMRNALPKAANVLITDYWKPLLIKCANEYGIDSFNVRDDIKKLTNLSLYLDSEATKQHPQITTKLLPALLNKMKQQITDNNLADDALNNVVRAIQNKSTYLPTEATTGVVQHKATPTEAVDNSSLSFDVKDDVKQQDDLENTLTFETSSEPDDITAFEVDEMDSFDFELSEEDIDSQPDEMEILEFELPEQPIPAEPDFVTLQQEIAPPIDATSTKTADIDDLPPLDLEPFKDDK